jgi:hypothetical protein
MSQILSDSWLEKTKARTRLALEKILISGRGSSHENTNVVVMAHNDSMKDIIELVEHLLDNPSKVGACKKIVMRESMESGILHGKCGGKEDTTPWPPQYGIWEKIPNYWLWSWIQDKYPEFTDAVMTDLIKAEKKVVRSLLELACGIKDKTVVDTRLHEKKLMARFLTELATKRGHRLKGWVGMAFAGSKVVDWGKAGSFRVHLIVDEKVNKLMWTIGQLEAISRSEGPLICLICDVALQSAR